MHQIENILPKYPYLRDGIDVFIGPDDRLTFVYLSSRKRLQLRCHPSLIKVLSWLRGYKTVDEIKQLMVSEKSKESDFDCSDSVIDNFLIYLSINNIIVSKDWLDDFGFPVDYKERIEKQLHFLMDVVDSTQKVKDIQSSIRNTKVAIFGLGGVGSWIALELVLMGFRNFVLIDQGRSTENDAARHAFFDVSKIGISKVDAAEAGLRAIDGDVEITTIETSLDINTNLKEIIGDVDFIINSADDPYIGYTSIKLSRYAIAHDLPMFVAGGFDAHLASFGELIIPRVTPCADCFVRFFKKALSDWNPTAHPVTNRSGGFGGWSPLSVISASATALQILKYYIDPKLVSKGRRIEFLATDYSTYTFEVQRDSNCKICGDK